MRQRVIIAMALALEPELRDHGRADDGARRRRAARDPAADRRSCKRELGFAVLFITHDLSLLLEFADRIAIMYAGEIVETAAPHELFAAAAAPVHAGLLSSFPPLHRPARADDRHPRRAAGPAQRRRPAAASTRAARTAMPDEPRRSTRARRRAAACCREVEPGHLVACHLVGARERARATSARSTSRDLTKYFPVGGAGSAAAQAARGRRRHLHAPARARSRRSSARAAAARARSRGCSRGCTSRPPAAILLRGRGRRARRRRKRRCSATARRCR